MSVYAVYDIDLKIKNMRNYKQHHLCSARNPRNIEKNPKTLKREKYSH